MFGIWETGRAARAMCWVFDSDGWFLSFAKIPPFFFGDIRSMAMFADNSNQTED